MSTDHPEIEWQYDANDISVVAKWLQACSVDGAITITREGVKDQVDTYMDTADWHMLRAGYGLRLRRKSGRVEATMKSMAAAVGGLRQRREINETIPHKVSTEAGYSRVLLSAPGDVGQRVRRITGHHALRVLFETRTRRTVYALNHEGQRLGEVDLDDTTIPSQTPGRDVHLKRIEIETGGSPQDSQFLSEFVKHMVKDCDLYEAAQSKFEAGLAAHDLQPQRIKTSDFGSTEVDNAITIGDLAYVMMRRHFAAMLAHEPGARLGEDLEEIHNMRVETRRLRAALNLFYDVLPQGIGRLRTELGWIAAALGAVRDLDVMLEQINTWRAAAAAAADESAYQSVIALLTTRRIEDHERLLAILDSSRYDKFVSDFTRLLRQPPAGPSRSLSTALKAAPALITARYRKLRKLGDTLRPDSPAPDYHQLRIRSKRLRYGLEFIERLYGKPAKAASAKAVRLQDTLGQFQDARTAMALLDEMRTVDGAPAATSIALGVVAGRYKHQAKKLLKQFPKAYERMKGKTWKGLMKAMHTAG